MPGTSLDRLAQLGQSIWLDYINRQMIDSGALAQWVHQGLRGVTSNPAIFNQVISSGDYNAAIRELKRAGKDTFAVYDELSTRDIRDAADVLKAVFTATRGLDGYVSLEIDPRLAHDAGKSIVEGKRLFAKVGRPNVMIKVPATPAGFPVVEALIAEGIPVNVTLIFSQQQYRDTAEAYMTGLERRAAKGGDLSAVRSVASVFVSRIDTKLDAVLTDDKLKGRAAVANSALIYALSKELFAQSRFQALAQKGAAIQRVLWGSTSTKNPSYRDVKYIEELIAADTVNTVPEPTLKAFMDHGQTAVALKGDAGPARETMTALKQAGVDLNAVCAVLLEEGVTSFEKAFDSLLQTVEKQTQTA